MRWAWRKQGELTVAGGAFSGGAFGVVVADARFQLADLGISAVDRSGVALSRAVQVLDGSEPDHRL